MQQSVDDVMDIAEITIQDKRSNVGDIRAALKRAGLSNNQVEVQGDEFDVPTDQLSFDIIHRGRRFPKLESHATPRPSYLHTCYDELTREFISTSVAVNTPTITSSVPFAPVTDIRFPEQTAITANLAAAKAGASNGGRAGSYPLAVLPVASAGAPSQLQADISSKGAAPLLAALDSAAIVVPPFMQHADPAFQGVESTFRSVAADSTHLLGRQPYTDTNILAKIIIPHSKDSFEPLFGSVVLFWVNSEHSIRISESFRFDLTTSQEIKNKFADVYFMMADDEVLKSSYSQKGNMTPGGGKGSKAPRPPSIRLDPVTLVTNAMFNIPDAPIKKSEIYLVAFVTKVLTGDNPAAPYFRSAYGGAASSSGGADGRHEDACKRLKFYRQQIGFGAIRLFDEQGRIDGPNVKVPIYATKQALGDLVIGQHIREMYFDRTNRIGLDVTELEIQISLFDLGNDMQVVQNLGHRQINLLDKQGNSLANMIPSQFNSGSESCSTHSWEGEPLADDKAISRSIRKVHYLHPPLALLQSGGQASSANGSTNTANGTPTALTGAVTSTGGSGAASVTNSGINNSADNSARIQSQLQAIEAATNLRRQLRMGVDNTLYVYPTQLDRFKHRNLCVKIQFVEFLSPIFGAVPDPTEPHIPLRNLYNNIPGPLFTSALFTTVWYHNKSPPLCDEFKIRLPDVVTDLHWLKFTVQHIHVNRDKAPNRQSIIGRTIGSMFQNAEHDKELDVTAVVVGVGFLPLRRPSGTGNFLQGSPAVSDLGSSFEPAGDGLQSSSYLDSTPLIADKEHTVFMIDTTDIDSKDPALSSVQSSIDLAASISTVDFNERRRSGLPSGKRRLVGSEATPVPFIRVCTRAISSFASTCSGVQAALDSPPMPLGQLPSSQLQFTHADLAREFTLGEDEVARRIRELEFASPLEVVHHFPVLFRQLIRGIVGGTGVYSEQCSDPFQHTAVRCQSFLMVLQLFGRLAPEGCISNNADKPSEMDVLAAFIEHFFDEEVPLELPISNLDRSVASPAASSNYSTESPWTSALTAIAQEKADMLALRRNVAAKYEVLAENAALANDVIIVNGEGDHLAPDSDEEESNQIENVSSPGGFIEQPNSSGENHLANVLVAELGLTSPCSEDEINDSPMSPLGDDVVSSSHRSLLRARNEANAISVDFANVSFGRDVTGYDADTSPETHSFLENADKEIASGYFASPGDSADPRIIRKLNFEGNSAKISDVEETELMMRANEAATGGIIAEDQRDVALPIKLSEEIAVEYEAYCVMHWTTQLERVVLEMLIEECVEQISSSSISLSDSLFARFTNTQSAERWWSQFGIMESKCKTTGAMLAKNCSPFDAERFWFNFVDRAPLDDDYQSFRKAISGALLSKFPPSFESIVESPVKPNEARNPSLILQLPVPPYALLHGYEKRKDGIDKAVKQIEQTMTMIRNTSSATDTVDPASPRASIGISRSFSSSSTSQTLLRCTNTPIHTHWWPWVYEVVAFQWATTLMALQGRAMPTCIPGCETVPLARFPFLVESIPRNSRLPHLDTRTLLLEHSLILFKMITKSLILRVVRERKASPVVLDRRCLGIFSLLVEAVAFEALAASNIRRARVLTKALAVFIRGLFAVIVPAQVSILVHQYFQVMDGKVRVEDTELRLLVLQELCTFDHFVNINYPLCVDIDKKLLGTFISTLRSNQSMLLTSHVIAVLGNEQVSPAAHWLSELVIQECMSIYRTAVDTARRTAVQALKTLNDTMVRMAFDPRYQSKHSRWRLSLLFWPLVIEMLKEVDDLSLLNAADGERKQLLGLFIAVVQDFPDDVLRAQLRALTVNTTQFDASKSLFTASALQLPTANPSTGSSGRRSRRLITSVKFSTMSSISSRDVLAALLREEEENVGLVASSGRASLSSEDVTGPSAPDSEASFVGLWSLLQMLHLCLESYQPFLDQKTLSASSSPATSSSTAAYVTQTPGASRHTIALATNKVELLERQQENRRQQYRAASIAGVSSTAAPPSVPVSANAGNTDNSTKTFHRRQQEIAAFTASAIQSNEPSITPDMQRLSSQSASFGTALVVCRVVSFILEECPQIFYSQASESTSEDAMLQFEQSLAKYRGILVASMFVLLHAVSIPVAEPCQVRAFEIATWFVSRFGAKLFMAVVGNFLQDWMRVVYRAWAVATEADSSTDESALSVTTSLISQAASNFLLTLLRAQFVYSGSISTVADVMLSVFVDAIEGILDWFGGLPHQATDEDELLRPVLLAVQNVSKATKAELKRGPSKFAAFYYAVNTLMLQLEVLLQAHTQMRRHVIAPVGFDWQGANMLDVSPNAKAAHITSALRDKRKLCARSNSALQLKCFPKMDVNEVCELFLEAANVYNAIRLPRQAIFWLEHLVILHTQRQHRAEAAETLWKIYEICSGVDKLWQNLWAPRRPLEWANASTPFATHKSFLSAVHAIRSAPSSHPWVNATQHSDHKASILHEAGTRFASVGSLFLAERCMRRQQDLLRLAQRIDAMHGEFQRMAGMIRSALDLDVIGAVTNARGSFYWVQFIGKGLPSFLNGKEYIYRSTVPAGKEAATEFCNNLLSYLKSVVVGRIDCQTFLNVQPTNTDHASPDAVAFITIVKPTPATESELLANELAGNHVSSFQYQFPYVKEMGISSNNSNNASTGGSIYFAAPKDAPANKVWLRSITFRVQYPFPYTLNRQVVCDKSSTDLSPIEVAIVEIDSKREHIVATLANGIRVHDQAKIQSFILLTVFPIEKSVSELARTFLVKPPPFVATTAYGRLSLRIASPSGMITSGASSTMPSPNPLRGENRTPLSASDSMMSVTSLPLSLIETGPVISPMKRNSSGLSQSFRESDGMRALRDKLKALVVEYLLQTKLLLAQTRKVFIVETGIDDGSTLAGTTSSVSSSHDNSIASPTSASTASLSTSGHINGGHSASTSGATLPIGGGGLIKAVFAPRRETARPATVAPLPASENPTLVWQNEIERAYDVILEEIGELLSDVPSFAKLQRNADIRVPLRIL